MAGEAGPASRLAVSGAARSGRLLLLPPPGPTGPSPGWLRPLVACGRGPHADSVRDLAPPPFRGGGPGFVAVGGGRRGSQPPAAWGGCHAPLRRRPVRNLQIDPIWHIIMGSRTHLAQFGTVGTVGTEPKCVLCISACNRNCWHRTQNGFRAFLRVIETV